MRSSQSPPPPDGTTRSLRKRRRAGDGNKGDDDGLQRLVELAEPCNRIVVFSGSGLSASAGMSMFSTKGGLYERACKRFKLSDGKRLFSWSFYDKQRREVTAFFADIHKEAVRAAPGPSHVAIKQLHDMGKLLRHYTMNVDGLAEQAGMSNWHHERRVDGTTVELHGNVRHLVCPACGHTQAADESDLLLLRRHKTRPCAACQNGTLRFKIMLYDDEEAETITPENVWDQLETDLETADLVLWVGISFEQSASTEYFRKVRRFLQANGRHDSVRQVVINPTDEAVFNLLSSCSNTDELSVVSVPSTSDTALAALLSALRADPAGLLAAKQRFDEERGEREEARSAAAGGARVPSWGARRPRFQRARSAQGWGHDSRARAALLEDAAPSGAASAWSAVAPERGQYDKLMAAGADAGVNGGAFGDARHLQFLHHLLAMRQQAAGGGVAASQAHAPESLPPFLSHLHKQHQPQLPSYAQLHHASQHHPALALQQQLQQASPGWGGMGGVPGQLSAGPALSSPMGHALGMHHPALQHLLASVGPRAGLAGGPPDRGGPSLLGHAGLGGLQAHAWEHAPPPSPMLNLRAQLLSSMASLGNPQGADALHRRAMWPDQPQSLLHMRPPGPQLGADAGERSAEGRTPAPSPTFGHAFQPPAAAAQRDAGAPTASPSPARTAKEEAAAPPPAAKHDVQPITVAMHLAAGHSDEAAHAAIELAHAAKKSGVEEASDGDASWTAQRGATTSPDSSPKSR